MKYAMTVLFLALCVLAMLDSVEGHWKRHRGHKKHKHDKKCKSKKSTSTITDEDAIDFCSPDPCQNGGICTQDTENYSYACSCPLGYNGTNCEIEQTAETCTMTFDDTITKFDGSTTMLTGGDGSFSIAETLTIDCGFVLSATKIADEVVELIIEFSMLTIRIDIAKGKVLANFETVNTFPRHWDIGQISLDLTQDDIETYTLKETSGCGYAFRVVLDASEGEPGFIIVEMSTPRPLDGLCGTPSSA